MINIKSLIFIWRSINVIKIFKCFSKNTFVRNIFFIGFLSIIFINTSIEEMIFSKYFIQYTL